MEIDINDYLDHDDITEIVKDTIKQEVRENIRSFVRLFNNKPLSDDGRLDNIMFYTFQEALNPFVEKYRDQIGERVQECIKQRDIYIYQREDVNKYIGEEVEKCRDILADKVQNILSNADTADYTIKQQIQDCVYELVGDIINGDKK